MADERTPDDEPVDPFGPEPDDVPDPMPDELEAGAAEEEARTDDIDPMEGPAPTG